MRERIGGSNAFVEVNIGETVEEMTETLMDWILNKGRLIRFTHRFNFSTKRGHILRWSELFKKPTGELGYIWCKPAPEGERLESDYRKLSDENHLRMRIQSELRYTRDIESQGINWIER